MKMKIGVTGAKGRLGSWLVKRYDFEPINCDVSDFQSVENAGLNRFDRIIHCAAYTDVDGCEKDAKKAYAVNATSVLWLKEIFKGQLYYISTDYIFPGTVDHKGPYKEDAKPRPISIYGKSKATGERYLDLQQDVSIRTTVLYDNHSGKGNFVSNILDALKFKVEIPGQFVPSNLFGSPTYVPHLAEGIFNLLFSDFVGIINIAGSTVISRYEFAKVIAKKFGFDDTIIVPKIYEKLDGYADRPLYAGLDVGFAKKFHVPIYSLDEGLEKYSKGVKYD